LAFKKPHADTGGNTPLPDLLYYDTFSSPEINLQATRQHNNAPAETDRPAAEPLDMSTDREIFPFDMINTIRSGTMQITRNKSLIDIPTLSQTSAYIVSLEEPAQARYK
jgi:hypothetical protein